MRNRVAAGASGVVADFNDNSWASGAAELGYNEGDEATVVSYGPSSSNKYITTYFRHTFDVPDSSLYTGLTVKLVRDDGAAVYLNGTEIVRSNLAAGAGYNTIATSGVSGGDESTFFEFSSIDANLLADGNNVLAVEVHQAAASSSDLSFNLELVGQSITGGVGTATDHLVRVTGLEANTKYYYKVGMEGSNDVLAGGDANHYFETSPEFGSTDPIRLWVIGDPGTASSSYGSACLQCQLDVRNAYTEYCADAGNGPARKADLVLIPGDVAYNDGTDAQYQESIFDVYPDQLRDTIFYTVQGNHDKPQNAYFDVWDMPTQAVGSGADSGTEYYYSFDYGNIHFVMLNSETDGLWDVDTSAMYTWLANDLANNSRQWTIAMYHHASYSRAGYNSDTETTMKTMREEVNPILEAAGVDLVFGGHSHAFERSYFINGHYGVASTFDSGTHVVQSGDGKEDGNGAYTKSGARVPNSGTVYVVTGNAGWTTGATGNFDHPANYFGEAQLGSVIVEVNDTRMDVKLLRELSPYQIDDYFTITHAVAGNDANAPTPDPMTWSSVPAATGTDTIAMTATTATDDQAGVQYFFDCVTDGNFDSSWQASASYTASSLSENTSYTFKTKARDTSSNNNETSWSTTASDTTDGAGPLAFLDDFETGSFTAGGWTTQNGDAKVNNKAEYEQTYGVEMKKATWFEKAQSTAGYDNIHVKYYRKTIDMDQDEYLYVEWYTTTSGWTNLETTQATSWGSQQDKTCAAGADDNSSFKVRFRTNADNKSDKAYVDYVEITGDAL